MSCVSCYETSTCQVVVSVTSRIQDFVVDSATRMSAVRVNIAPSFIIYSVIAHLPSKWKCWSLHVVPLSAGLMITTLVSYLSHSQIWALQEEAMLHVGGRTNRATIAFAGELSTILDSVPDRGSSQSSAGSEQLQNNGALALSAGPLYIEADSNKVKQVNPGAGANRNPAYVPSDTAGNMNGSSIGFASLDDVE